VELQTRWRLFDGDGRLLTTERTDLTEQAAIDDYPSIVDAMSRAVEELAARIVTVLPAAVATAGRDNERKRSS
jgi:uncharacterized lipoprotein YmbA